MTKINNVFHKVSALTWREKDLYVAQAIGVEVVSQGSSKMEALNNLREALELYFEGYSSPSFKETHQDISLEEIDIRYA